MSFDRQVNLGRAVLEAREDAAKEERKAVVESLRRRAREYRTDGYYSPANAMDTAADAIERGEHLPGGSK